MTDEALDIPEFLRNQQNFKKETAASESELSDLLSSGDLGWQIRKIKYSNGDQVMLNDGVSFTSPCFAGAMPGDLWAVKHEPGNGCYGCVKSAVLLESYRRR